MAIHLNRGMRTRKSVAREGEVIIPPDPLRDLLVLPGPEDEEVWNRGVSLGISKPLILSHVHPNGICFVGFQCNIEHTGPLVSLVLPAPIHSYQVWKSIAMIRGVAE